MGKLTHSPAASQGQTFPQLLLQHAASLRGGIAMREKYRGVWRAWSWDEVARETRALAAGLRSLGFKKGDVLVVLGDNRPRLYWAICAAQMLGGVALPLCADTPGKIVAREVRKYAVRFALVDEEQHCGKLVEARAAHADLVHVFLDCVRNSSSLADLLPGMRSLDEIVARGRELDQGSPGDVDGEIAAGNSTDPAVILVCPDATGDPTSAVVQTHAQGVAAARAQVDGHEFPTGEELVAYLPLGSWMDQHFSYALPLVCGLTVSCPESVDTVPIDMREVGPTLHAMPCKMLVRLHASTLHRMSSASALQRALFEFFTGSATGGGGGRSRVAPVRWLGEILFHAPLRDVLGLSRTKVMFVGDADGGEEALHFFRAIGLRLANATDCQDHCEPVVCMHGACGTPSAVTGSEK